MGREQTTRRDGRAAGLQTLRRSPPTRSPAPFGEENGPIKSRFKVVRALAVPAVLTLSLLGACTSISPVVNASGTPTVELDPSSRGPVAGVGIEMQDIQAMADQMIRDMLADPMLASRSKPPQVIIDAEYFSNQSSQRINRNLITDNLRVGLNRAAHGRMIFVSRESADMVEKERQLKRQGKIDVGTIRMTAAQAGGDFRLRGRITSLDSRDPRTGMMQRYNQITFEMIDLERGTSVWAGIYKFARAAADDVVYR